MSRPINFYAPVGFEPWDHRSPDGGGIGGSETHVVEMSWRLANRGYEVKVFAPIPEDCPREWRGTRWFHHSEADPSEEALWVLCRCPSAAALDFRGEVWLVCQDVDYPGGWDETHSERIDKVIALCQTHRGHLEASHPETKGKVDVSSNAAKIDLFEEIEFDRVVERDPNRLIWASSPDRGLVQAVLPSWHKVREFVPTAELHIYYGFNNMDRAIETDPVAYHRFAKIRAEFDRLVDQPGVYYHGRVGQRELYEAWLSSSIWPYWSDFTETSCVTCMEAQASGAIPVTRPIWAVGENVTHGVGIHGSAYDEPLSRASLVASTIRLLLSEEYQESIRLPMIVDARQRFHWERIVDQWLIWMEGWPIGARYQFSFQHRHMEGRTLNIGANADSAELRSRGAVNVDMHAIDPNTDWVNSVHALADAFALPFPDGSFDTAILGDIIEHCKTDEDARQMVAEAKRVASRVIITCPEDYRNLMPGVTERHEGQVDYSDRTWSYHRETWDRERLIGVAGEPKIHQVIRYDFGNGHGMVV